MSTPIAFTRPDQRQVELLAWSDHDLDTLADISDTDIARAQGYWRSHLPRRYRLLLEATSPTNPDGLHLVG